MRADRPGEFERIRRIVAGLPRGGGVVEGPGDDAAVVRPREGHDLVITTDAFVEGRHYRTDLLDARAIGRRLAAANLSDLAAMAARPRWATIAACSPPGADPAAQRAIETACARALAREGAAVVGGNLGASRGPAWWAVTLVGEVERGRHWTRAGARPGDVLAVTGIPGLAAATLAGITHARRRARTAPRVPQRYASPPSRVGAARAMAATGAVRAAIDLSDGLPGDLARLCEAGGVGAVIEAARLPVGGPFQRIVRGLLADRRRPGAPRNLAREREVAQQFCLGPSDDYELLVAVAPERFEDCARAAGRAGASLLRIGEVTARRRRLLMPPDGRLVPLPGRGFDHFA